MSIDKLRSGLVVSVQPVDDGPMDKPAIIAAMCLAAVEGGANGLRVEGIENLQTVRSMIEVPIIGIVKRESEGTPVRITPTAADSQALVDAGADIIAVDMTFRRRPEPLAKVIQPILAAKIPLMADCATRDEGAAALEQGAQIIGTTLSGYTSDTITSDDEPDYALINEFRLLAGEVGFVMAEGRFNSPALAAKAIKAGADCVTVGSAITRLEHVVGWYATAIRENHL